MKTAVFSAAAVSLLIGGAALASAVPAVAEKRGCTKRHGCNHDNLLRCFLRTPTLAAPFCSSAAGVVPTPSTVTVTEAPTISVTATSTALETITTSLTDTVSLPTTVTDLTTITSVTTFTFTVRARTTVTAGLHPPCEVLIQRGSRPQTSLACIANLAPPQPSIASACSCFSGSYQASLPPVTVTATLPEVTYTAATVLTTLPVTVEDVVTVTSYVTTTITSTVTVPPAICTLPA
ncbi:hypothetical protein VTK73DRAFT_7749 [Phialemonium thermophilum]|uniref:Uncharacterized protein n=1 Tax=Phialemonium thermophilum TaxID=223376 RepID=A0ABR3WCX0_9PEZI